MVIIYYKDSLTITYDWITQTTIDAVLGLSNLIEQCPQKLEKKGLLNKVTKDESLISRAICHNVE